MLKGKKSIYILLPLNLLIWGYMGYKIYAAFHEDDAMVSAENMISAPKPKTEDSAEYILSLDYKDPFLKEEPKAHTPRMVQAPIPQPAVVQKPVAPPVEKKLADIKYLGIIENKSSGSMAAMISVNGSSQIIKPGQTIDDMVFQTITAEFIVVKIGKEKLTIRK